MLEHLLGLRIEFKARQDLFMTHSAARVLVHDLDQLSDRVTAVTDDMARRSTRCRDQLAVDDQQPMVITLQERLDDHRPRMLARDQVALRDFFVGAQPNGDTAAVIAVVWFGHHGESNTARGADGMRFTLDKFLLGDRQSEQAQNLVGLLLVAGQFDRNVRGAAGDRRLDALLVLAMTQLHQRLIIEPEPRNAAVFRRAYQ